MGRLSEYSEEERDIILGFTCKDSIEEVSPEEQAQILILNRLSQLGIEAADTGYEDLSSALSDLEFLFLTGYGKLITSRLRTVSDEIRSTLSKVL